MKQNAPGPASTYAHALKDLGTSIDQNEIYK